MPPPINGMCFLLKWVMVIWVFPDGAMPVEVPEPSTLSRTKWILRQLLGKLAVVQTQGNAEWWLFPN